LVAVLTLPLLDAVTAVARRWLAGRSVFVPDCGHIHHRLRGRLGSTVAALFAAAGLAVLGSAGAAFTRAYDLGDHVAGLGVVISVGLLLGTNTFGLSESRLLVFRIRSALASFYSGATGRRRAIRGGCHLHGIRDWAVIWDDLVREVEDCGVWRIELAIDIATAGEVYHGFWARPASTQHGPSWSIVHTLHTVGAPAGVLRVAGGVALGGSPYLDKVEKLVRVLEARLALEGAAVSAAQAPPLPDVTLTVESAVT
jgi:UDP-GlcNAc:undecaprenyl-phosphate GlcNAc-1-phosphate transferase